MNELRIFVEVEVKPTEDLEKVKKAVLNLFPGALLEAQLSGGGGFLEGGLEGRKGLDRFKKLLGQQRIRDAAKAILLGGERGRRVIFFLRKQAAYVNRVSFCESPEEAPLGPIKIDVECESLGELIGWLTKKPLSSRRRK